MTQGVDNWWPGCDDPDPPEDSTPQVIAEIPSPEELTCVIRQERVSQAHWSYACALTLAVAGCLLMFIAVGFFVFGSIAAGALTIAGGAISEVVGKMLFRLNRESNDRLTNTEKDLVNRERAQLSGVYASKILDPSTRDKTLTEITRGLNKEASHESEELQKR
jgi:hypothetical protein